LLGRVHHILEPDPLQEIYGMPEYISALQSGLLNENATLFRRRYYLNGSHAGFILYISEAGMQELDIEALRMPPPKGAGQLPQPALAHPQRETGRCADQAHRRGGRKRRTSGIKEVTRDDMLSAHRTPPQLLGIVPKNGTGFGNVIDAARSFYHLEIVPIQCLSEEDNVGFEAVAFKEPDDITALLASVAPGAAK
jgi:hypothetical protein